MREVWVSLGDRSYPIRIGRGLLEEVGGMLRGLGRRAAVVTNPTVAELYLEPLRRGLERAGIRVGVVTVPDGEEAKGLEVLARVYDALAEMGLERHSPLIALGGGVVGDLAGFAAATYLRGLPLVQVPTTLLAQVDSSVGGKVAIDHPRAKNLIGAFHQPRLVVIDLATLETLPGRQLRAGMAEVVKYGVIRDPELFELVERHGMDPCTWGELVERCCRIKAWVVERDEREQTGLRSILNFGHTLGHAVEALEGYRGHLHGEAVAMGMAEAARISRRLGLCAPEEVDRLVEVLRRLGLPTELPPFDPERYREVIRLDKKVREGRVRFVALRRIGEVQLVSLRPEEII